MLQPAFRAAYSYLKKHYALEKLLFTFFYFLSLLSKDSRIKWKKQNRDTKNKKLLRFTPYCHSKNITLSSLLLFSSLALSFSTALKKWKWNYIFIFAALIHTPPIYVKMEDLFSPCEWASSFLVNPALNFMKILQAATLDPTGPIGGEGCAVYYNLIKYLNTDRKHIIQICNHLIVCKKINGRLFLCFDWLCLHC